MSRLSPDLVAEAGPMSRLTNDLAQAVKVAQVRGRECTVCTALAHLSLDDQVSLRAALKSNIGAKRLSIILQKNGVAVGVPSIRLHRLEGHK
jgi:hypothetical protein